MDAAFRKAAPLTGITFAVLYLFGGMELMKGAPGFGAKPADITTYFADHAATIALGSLLIFVAAPFWFIFLGCVYAAIKDKEDGAGRLAVTQLASGASAAAVSIVGALCAASGALRANNGTLGTGAATVYFDASTALLYTGTAVAAAAFLFCVAVASLRYDAVVPKWLGFVAFALAAAFLIPPISWITLPLGVLLVMAASFFMYREEAGTV